MDVIIPLGKGSLWQDNELRYALRSIEKNLKDYENIVIVGEKPEWVTGVHFIPQDDPYRCKERNIMEKVRTACLTATVSDLFLFSNDDIYFMEPISIHEVLYWHSGTIASYSEGKRLNGYMECMKRTNAILIERGVVEPLYYDIHVPIPYAKKLFLEVMAKYEWRQKSTYTIKSLYCNTLGIRGVYMDDVKRKEGHQFYSTTDKILGLQRQHLMEKFPEPSRYEL